MKLTDVLLDHIYIFRGTAGENNLIELALPAIDKILNNLPDDFQQTYNTLKPILEDYKYKSAKFHNALSDLSRLILDHKNSIEFQLATTPPQISDDGTIIL